MAYSQYTLAQVSAQVSARLDDTSQVYWTPAEIQFAIWEALRVWGALTSYWRTRGNFNLIPTQCSPFYDLSVVLPALRTRAWTLGQLTQEIQFALLENPSGVPGTGMSQQVSITQILNAIQRARDRFVIDTHLPLSAHSIGPGSVPTGLFQFPQSIAYVHRAGWQDSGI